MTIISAVYVPEGIAMAADSRLTGVRKYKNGHTDRMIITDNAQKIVLVRDSTIGISFSGEAIIEGVTVGDFLRVFDIDQVNRDDRVETVANKLKHYLSTKYSKYKTEFLIAGYDDDEPFIYSVTPSAIKRYNKKENLLYGATWRGEVKSVSKLLADTPFHFKLMPLKDAVDFSEFIIEIAIKYSRFTSQLSTCGGPIDILVVTKDYTKFYRHKIL